jgi:DNA-binding beta-propeller fold protein YncE
MTFDTRDMVPIPDRWRAREKLTCRFGAQQFNLHCERCRLPTGRIENTITTPMTYAVSWDGACSSADRARGRISMKTLLAFVAAAASAVIAHAAAAEGYHLLQRVQITPGDGIFDYAAADGANRRVYFSHGEELVVLDADSHAVVGKVPAPQFDPSYGIGIAGRTTPYQGIHHVAIAAELGRGFTANGRAGSSTIFDLKTLAKIGDVKLTGEDPNAIIFDAATKRVFAFNEDTDNASVFDANSGMVLGTIPLGGHPAFAASDDKGHVFVNIISKNLVQRINSRNLTVEGEWPAGCAAPHNETMAIDKDKGRLFVGCRPDFRRMLNPPGPRPDRIMTVLDTNNGHIVATVPIGGNPDQAAFDPGAGLAFSANGEGNVTVIKQEAADKYGVLETVTTEPGAARLAVDPKTHKIFAPNNDPDPDPSIRGRNFRVLILGM